MGRDQETDTDDTRRGISTRERFKSTWKAIVMHRLCLSCGGSTRLRRRSSAPGPPFVVCDMNHQVEHQRSHVAVDNDLWAVPQADHEPVKSWTADEHFWSRLGQFG